LTIGCDSGYEQGHAPADSTGWLDGALIQREPGYSSQREGLDSAKETSAKKDSYP
jgi:hypothetical protein